MLVFSRTAGYAILALGCIASWKGQWVLSKQVHQCTGIPTPYLRKMLFALAKAGLIRAKRGYQGGFVLARPPEEITFLDVVQAVDPGQTFPECILGLPNCSASAPCPLHAFWQEERAKIEGRLSQVSLAQAAEFVRCSWKGRALICPSPEKAPAFEPPPGKVTSPHAFRGRSSGKAERKPTESRCRDGL